MYAFTLVQACSLEGHHITRNRLLNRLYFDRDMGGPTFPLKSWMAMLNQALIRSHCTTVDRVAMFLAQLGAESGSFRYTQELASGAEYNYRADLGNIYAGDGERYKGRTYIQITGRHNYGALSAWAFDKKYIPTKTYFVDHPERLGNVEYIFLGPVWYWTVARNMNYYADNRDIEGATRAVNGGLNNLAGRNARWLHARTFGTALLPTGVTAKHRTPVTPPPVKRPSPKPKPQPVSTMTVHSGDTLSSIATRYNTTWQNLQRINNLRDPNMIYVGQTLRVG